MISTPLNPPKEPAMSRRTLLQTAAGPVKAQTQPDAPRCVMGEALRFDLPLALAVALES